MTAMDITYRNTAVGGASGLSLLIALYDTLIGNLRRAAEAQRDGRLDTRANELKHAISVIGCLENWTDPSRGELAQQLAAFYSGLRRAIMLAQTRQSAELLEEQMHRALQIRQTWHDVNTRPSVQDVEILPPAPAATYGLPSFVEDSRPRSAQSWSA
ncbi:MAG TPA: flagellar export chaperone FliS [Terracidiphilus sp.]|jgi:flagellar protein FliS